MKLPFKGLSNIQKFAIALSAAIVIAIIDYVSFLDKSAKVEIYDDLNDRISSARVSITKLEYLLDMLVVARRFEGGTIGIIKGDVDRLDEGLNEIMDEPRYRNFWKKDSLLAEGMTSIHEDWLTIRGEIGRLNDALSQDEIMLIHNAVDMNTILVTEKAERLLAVIAKNRHALFEDIKGLALRSVAGFILIILLASLVVHRKGFSPVAKAADVARRIASGDARARFREDRRSAMGRLASELNRAFDAVSSASERKASEAEGLSEGLKAKADQIEALNRIALLAGRSLAASEVYSYALNEAVRLTGAEAGAVYVREEGRLALKASAGFGDVFTKDGASVPETHFPAASAPGGWTLEQERFPDNAFGRLFKLFDSRLLAGAPLLYNGEIKGFLMVSFRDAARFSVETMPFLEAAASTISVASGHSELFQRELSARRFLGRVTDQMPYGLAVFDRDGTCVVMNSPLKRMLGADQRYNPALYRVFEDDVLAGQGVVASIRKSYEGYSTEFVINYSPISVKRCGFTGPQRKLKIKSFPFYDSGGEISNIVLLYEDLTEAEPAASGGTVQ